MTKEGGNLEPDLGVGALAMRSQRVMSPNLPPSHMRMNRPELGPLATAEERETFLLRTLKYKHFHIDAEFSLEGDRREEFLREMVSTCKRAHIQYLLENQMVLIEDGQSRGTQSQEQNGELWTPRRTRGYGAVYAGQDVAGAPTSTGVGSIYSGRSAPHGVGHSLGTPAPLGVGQTPARTTATGALAPRGARRIDFGSAARPTPVPWDGPSTAGQPSSGSPSMQGLPGIREETSGSDQTRYQAYEEFVTQDDAEDQESSQEGTAVATMPPSETKCSGLT